MTANESRSAAVAATLLLLASAGRYGVEAFRSDPIMAPDSTVLPELLEASEARRDEDERRKTPLGEGERLDPNGASEVELDRLPGVGPTVARAIVKTRETMGAFASVDDLVRVPGIGPATVERIREHLELSPVVPGATRQRGSPARTSNDRKGLQSATGRPLLSQYAREADERDSRVDVNGASEQELERLPGIGPALAERIVRSRVARGGFRSVDELIEIWGIGPATLERLRPLVKVGRGGA